ncbi:hypothetical protein Lal_00018660 [Lupinus albus]|nr:hypothetical protein Lal_00018660 [Lupinus albus]
MWKVLIILQLSLLNLMLDKMIIQNQQLGRSSRSGTKYLHNHMELCVRKKIMTRGHDKGQSFLMPKASQVDYVGFRRYSTSLQPLFQVHSRNTTKETFKVYDFERKCAMKMLDSHEGRVAITSDMWTSGNQKRGYMAVTTHYIDLSWTLKSRVLRFTYFPTPHISDILSYALVECFMEWNVDKKISTITLDNFSTNDAIIPRIKDSCDCEICCGMIKDELEVVKDDIEKIQDSVAYWNATPKRNKKIEETTKQLRFPYTRKLILDCLTRWNSKYKMFEIAILYKAIKLEISQWMNSSNELIKRMTEKMMTKFERY